MKGLLLAIVLLLYFVVFVHSYRVQGNTIIDNSGKPILLRGIARPSLEWNDQGQQLSLSDYSLMKAWGSNVVRLSLSQCFWLTNPSYNNTVAQQVALIKSLGMAVILDLHWSDEGGIATCDQRKMADSNSITFWTQVASIYANDPDVLFELYNEPFGVAWTVWLNGGATGDGWNAVGMQTLYDTVRATGAQNVVIVVTFDLSGIASYPVVGTNIVYNTHPYNFDGKQTSDWYASFGYLAASHPLIATEFGNTQDCNFISYANQLSMSYTGWGWWVQGCSFPSLIADWSGTPSASGVFVKADLLNTPKVPQGNVTGGGGVTIGGHASGFSATTRGSTIGYSSTTGRIATGANVTVYSEYVQTFQDWSWAVSRQPQDTTEHHSGSNSYSFVPAIYQAVYFYYSGYIDTSVHRGVEFWVNGGSTGSQHIKFNLIRFSSGSSNKIGPDQEVATYLQSFNSIPANAWARGFVSFSSFPSGTYDGFWFQDSTGGTQTRVYLDDVVLVGFDQTVSTTGEEPLTTGTTNSTGNSTGDQINSTTRTTMCYIALILIVSLAIL